MRVLILCAVLVAGSASAAEKLLGTITTTTTKNNGDTAVTFTIPCRTKVSVQCDLVAYVNASCGRDSTCTATASTGVKIAADQLFLTNTPAANGTNACYVAALSVSGSSAACDVFQRSGEEG